MPPTFFTNPAAQLTLLLFLVGIVGAIVPILPGSLFIWLGILAWAFGERFQRFDWLMLTGLGILALLATFSEYWLRPLVQYRAGFGFKHILAAIAGGILGGMVLSVIPLVGTFFGAVIGSILSTGVLAYYEKRNWHAAWRASKAYLIGCALSSLIEIFFSLLMLAIFFWRAFFN